MGEGGDACRRAGGGGDPRTGREDDGGWGVWCDGGGAWWERGLTLSDCRRGEGGAASEVSQVMCILCTYYGSCMASTYLSIFFFNLYMILKLKFININ